MAGDSERVSVGATYAPLLRRGAVWAVLLSRLAGVAGFAAVVARRGTLVPGA